MKNYRDLPSWKGYCWVIKDDDPLCIPSVGLYTKDKDYVPTLYLNGKEEDPRYYSFLGRVLVPSAAVKRGAPELNESVNFKVEVRNLMDNTPECKRFLDELGVSSKVASQVACDAVKSLTDLSIEIFEVPKDFKL
ncbi:hypothetical protein NVP1178O_65 [Vibrio phage 1.178.O._10N.286.45.E12]|nr:hypothetical protein NVP1178O_65 [Vibrio phage 1.178.O._10N.286.45.E12]